MKAARAAAQEIRRQMDNIQRATENEANSHPVGEEFVDPAHEMLAEIIERHFRSLVEAAEEVAGWEFVGGNDKPRLHRSRKPSQGIDEMSRAKYKMRKVATGRLSRITRTFDD